MNKAVWTLYKSILPGCLLLLVLFPIACDTRSNTNQYQPDIEKHQLQGLAFGTRYNILIYSNNLSQKQKENLQSSVTALIQKQEDSLSNWKPESQISILNQAPAYKHIKVTPEFTVLVKQSLLLYNKTDRLFDPASAALFALWQFKPQREFQSQHTIDPDQLPENKQIQLVQKKSGMDQIGINGNAVWRKNTLVQLNFSAIAKGYLVDKIFELLSQKGFQSVMVEVGGEVRVGSYPSKQHMDEASPVVTSDVNSKASRARTENQAAYWKIGIEKPEYRATQELLFIALLKNQSLATSGDYRNYYIVAGDPRKKRRSHIINPRTGQPKESGTVSASVIGPECMIADALATTLILLQPQAGLKLMQNFPAYKALLISGSESAQSKAELKLYYSDGLMEWLQEL